MFLMINISLFDSPMFPNISTNHGYRKIHIKKYDVVTQYSLITKHM